MGQLRLQIQKLFKIAYSSFVRTILICVSLVAVSASPQSLTEFQPKP